MSPARKGTVQSMTGYGRAAKQTAVGTVTVELRSTNHRYLEVDQRLPNGFSALQGRLTELFRAVYFDFRVQTHSSLPAIHNLSEYCDQFPHVNNRQSTKHLSIAFRRRIEPNIMRR